MNYADLLRRLAKFGITQVARLTVEGGDDIAYLGRQEQNIFPFSFVAYPIFLDNGVQSFIDPYLIGCVCRRFELKEAEINPVH